MFAAEGERRLPILFWLCLILSFLAGGLIGVFFFGGLWWTVQRITGSGRPYLISVVSFFLRTAVVLAAFYCLLQAGWQFLLAALFGFIIARTILAYKLKQGIAVKREAEHK